MKLSDDILNNVDRILNFRIGLIESVETVQFTTISVSEVIIEKCLDQQKKKEKKTSLIESKFSNKIYRICFQPFYPLVIESIECIKT